MRKLKLYRLSLICLLLFNSGCSWLALADTSYSQKEYDCSKKLEAEIKQEEIKLDSQLVGLSKEEVTAKLGKPNPRDIKLGEHRYIADRNCFGKKCETELSDEAWFYELVKQMPSCGRYAYSIIIYFLNGKVVRVG